MEKNLKKQQKEFNNTKLILIIFSGIVGTILNILFGDIRTIIIVPLCIILTLFLIGVSSE